MTSTKEDMDPLMGPGIHRRTLRLSGDDLVWLRGVMEAYEGLGFVVGRGDGQVHVLTTSDQAAILDSLLADLALEVQITCLDSRPDSELDSATLATSP